MHGVRRSDTEDAGADDEEQAQVREYRALHDRVVDMWARVEHEALADAAREDRSGLYSGPSPLPDKSAVHAEKGALATEGNDNFNTVHGHARAFVDDALQTTRDMLLQNPEFMTAWALRRWALRRAEPPALCAEGSFGVEAIRANPKAYGAWHHRRWLLATVCAREEPAGRVATRARELALCDKLLALDARNFHCWNYRLWLCTDTPGGTACDPGLVHAEFAATTRMIHANFSNYSAWHRRALLLPLVLGPAGTPDAARTFDDEVRLVRQAYWTQPHDQSAWFYVRQLVAHAHDPAAAAAAELAAVDELLAEEPRAAQAHAAAVCLARIAGLPVDPARIERLIEIDPMRRGMYQSWLGAQ